MKIEFLLQKLDNWSDEIIKNSFLGRLVHLKQKTSPSTHLTLLLSIIVLFISLSLPQFANDRFGIGIIILICFFIFIVNLLLNNLTFIQFGFLDFLLIIFLLLAAISTSCSYFFKESFQGFLKYIIFFLCYFILKITVTNITKKQFMTLWLCLFLCATVVSGIGIYQYLIGVEPLATWEDPLYENIHTRVYSTLGNPNLLGGYLLTILPVSIFLPFEFRQRTISKILFFIGSLLILICILFTGSRGAYLGLLATFLTGSIIFIFKQRKPFFVLAIPTLILILMFLFPIFTERISTIFTMREHTSNSYRLNVWISSFKMLKDNLFLGIGPGNQAFLMAYGLYMISGFDALSAYNIFLEFAVETGILGALIFILIFTLSFLKLHLLFWQKNKLLSGGIFISLLALLTHGMVDTVFFRPQIFVPFWFLLASIARIEKEEGQGEG